MNQTSEVSAQSMGVAAALSGERVSQTITIVRTGDNQADLILGVESLLQALSLNQYPEGTAEVLEFLDRRYFRVAREVNISRENTVTIEKIKQEIIREQKRQQASDLYRIMDAQMGAKAAPSSLAQANVAPPEWIKKQLMGLNPK